MPSKIRVLKRLPLTASGKVDRRALLALPSEDRKVKTAICKDLDPRVYLVMRAIEMALDLDEGTVQSQDDFFALGGDSLSAMHATQLISKALGKSLSVQVTLDPVLAHVSYFNTLVQDFTKCSDPVSLVNLLDHGDKDGRGDGSSGGSLGVAAALNIRDQMTASDTASVGRGNKGHGSAPRVENIDESRSREDEFAMEFDPLWETVQLLTLSTLYLTTLSVCRISINV